MSISIPIIESMTWTDNMDKNRQHESSVAETDLGSERGKTIYFFRALFVRSGMENNPDLGRKKKPDPQHCMKGHVAWT